MNYKTQQLHSIGTVHKHLLKPDETMKILNRPNSNVANTKSHHDNLVNYQVPTGKTFYAVEVEIVTIGAVGGLTFFTGDTADTATTAVHDIIYVHADKSIFTLALNFQIASEKFLVSVISASSSIYDVHVIGYEK